MNCSVCDTKIGFSNRVMSTKAATTRDDQIICRHCFKASTKIVGLSLFKTREWMATDIKEFVTTEKADIPALQERVSKIVEDNQSRKQQQREAEYERFKEEEAERKLASYYTDLKYLSGLPGLVESMKIDVRIKPDKLELVKRKKVLLELYLASITKVDVEANEKPESKKDEKRILRIEFVHDNFTYSARIEVLDIYDKDKIANKFINDVLTKREKLARETPIEQPKERVQESGIEERLTKLKKLLDSGLISESDYEDSKKDILSSL